MGFTVLFQLVFTFIYSTLKKNQLAKKVFCYFFPSTNTNNKLSSLIKKNGEDLYYLLKFSV